MTRSRQVQERWRKQRLDGKSAETMFQNRLIEEARCSPIVARAILGMVHETLVGTDDLPSYGQRIEDTQFVPVLLDLVTRDDLDLLLDGREWNDLCEARITRLCEQAHAQGGLLSQADMGLLLAQSNSAISQAVRAQFRASPDVKLLPSRGSLHDLGQTVSHKRSIC